MDILREIRRIRGEENLKIEKRNTNPYRVLVKEEDGITAYYCSVPVYSKEGKLLLPKWRKEDGRYRFQGINAEIAATEEKVILQNDYGSAEIAFADDVSIEPTFNGIAVVCGKSKTKFSLETSSERTVRESAGCFALMREEFTPFLSVNGIIGKTGGGVCPLRVNGVKRGEKAFEMTVESAAATEILFEVDLHAPKLVLDTTVASKLPDENNAFGGAAFLGNTEEYGEQWLYSRFDTTLFADLNFYRVKEATLYLPKWGGECRLDGYKMDAPWCSFASTWNTKAAFSRLLYTARRSRRYERMDVSEILRDILRLHEPRNSGFVIKSGQEKGVSAVSTGDNYDKPQILEIKLKNN